MLALPRARQPEALRRMRARLPARPEPEAWNSRFGPGSLYEAWAESTIMHGLYRHNAAAIRQALAGRDRLRALELGGGDGRIWRQALPPDTVGELWLVDPVPEVASLVARALPAGVRLHYLPGRIEALLEGGLHLPEVDLVQCSLCLHHVAGRDAAERARHGLSGLGKGEVLDALGAAVARSRGGILVNEADVHCEIDLEAGDPLLEERMLDSYVRRCASSLLQDAAARPEASDDLRARWQAVALHWCIEQLDLAHVPLAERDVYELDQPRWRELFAARGLTVERRVSTDDAALFWQYLLRSR